ncbi:hypothetical protein LL912_13055 [Niabella sp. CC-SYL272]|uniref:LIC11966 family surface protein n=1 Tax=Niabella agricola TaxID=2891571 RepID=UPI001F2DC32D|nr:hypothetical protein [Niabella agricola]MCF3109702.1 hypothetical protein [Niabella agricola]
MRKFYLILMSAIVLISCGGNQKQAVEYNNQLVKIQQEVAAEAQKFGQLTQTADSAQAYHTLADLSTYVNDEAKKAEALQFDGDDFGMKASLLDGFRFFKKVLGEDFKKILGLRFSTAPPADAQQQMQLIVTNIQKEGQDIDKKFLDAQQQFAKKYKIQLRQL